MTNRTTRRDFLKIAGTGAVALGASSLLPRVSHAAREKELNLLTWGGYGADSIIRPFEEEFDCSVQYELHTSDADSVNRLRAGETAIWDLINVDPPWAPVRMWPEKLIVDLPRDQFEPYYEQMLPRFHPPYKWAMSFDGEHLLGMIQRFGTWNFVVNSDVISKKEAEEGGWDLFNDPAMNGRFGILTWDDYNIQDMCIGAGFSPWADHTEDQIAQFERTARNWFAGAKILTDDFFTLNFSLINGEIDAYFCGGNYSISGARFDGQWQLVSITPLRGPVDGKGGITWEEITSPVNNPNFSPRAYDFLHYVQRPDVAHTAAIAEGGTLNAVAQMGNPDCLALYTKDELRAIEWETLEADMERTIGYSPNPNYDRMLDIYTTAKRERTA